MVQMLRILLVTMTLLIKAGLLFSQGFSLKFCGEDYRDQTLILSHRFGGRFFSDDTVRTGPDGCARFYSAGVLPEGMYQLVFENKKYIEFFLEGTQDFSIKLPAGATPDQARFIGSEANSQFSEWQRQMSRNQAEMATLQRKLRQPGLPADSLAETQAQSDLLQSLIEDLWNKGTTTLAGTLPGDFIRGLRPLALPAELMAPGSADQPLKQYLYYTRHFFDQVDLTDARLLRTPLIENKLSQYFKRILTPVADSIIQAADQVISQTGSRGDTYQFVVQYLLNLYSEPEIMGTDAVYVHIAENYYLNGKAHWIEEVNLHAIRERVDDMKPLLIGSPAPPLTNLIRLDNQPFNLTDIKARFIILYFWEPDCGHCKESTPKLHQLYGKIRSEGGEVIAINTRLETEGWNEFVTENGLSWINAYSPVNIRQVIDGYQAWSTPKIFVLSGDYHIVAKDLAVEQVAPLLDHYLKRGDRD
ncbi:MAG: DUF5106 domain-containing protein [Bacteroidales bacterium]